MKPQSTGFRMFSKVKILTGRILKWNQLHFWKWVENDSCKFHLASAILYHFTSSSNNLLNSCQTLNFIFILIENETIVKYTTIVLIETTYRPTAGISGGYPDKYLYMRRNKIWRVREEDNYKKIALGRIWKKFMKKSEDFLKSANNFIVYAPAGIYCN